MPASAPASAPASVPATAPAAAPRIYPGSVRGDLKIALPPGWVDTVDPGARAGAPSTVRFTDSSRSFEMLLTIIPAPPAVRDFNSMARLRELADLQGKRLLADAVETKLETQELKGSSGSGLLYTISDKTPSPGSFEFMTGLLMGVGDMLLNVTIMTHQKDSPQRRAAIELVSGAHQVAAGSAVIAPAATTPSPAAATQATTQPTLPATRPQAPSPGLVAALPERSWSILLDVPELQPVEDQVSADGRSRRIFAVDARRPINVSIYLEPAPNPSADSKGVREFYLNRLLASPMPMKDVRASEMGEFAVLQYVVPDLNQKHVNLYLCRDGVWVDVHFSAMRDPGAQADAALDALMNSVRVEASR
jgi:hypothetical protein